jgi:hypothetical protein
MVTVAAAPQAIVTATRRSSRYCIVPKPAVPLRRCAGQKRLTGDVVKAEIWRPQFKCAVSAVTLMLADHRASNGYRRID